MVLSCDSKMEATAGGYGVELRESLDRCLNRQPNDDTSTLIICLLYVSRETHFIAHFHSLLSALIC